MHQCLCTSRLTSVAWNVLRPLDFTLMIEEQTCGDGIILAVSSVQAVRVCYQQCEWTVQGQVSVQL